jgi:RHS repeat-associated protein
MATVCRLACRLRDLLLYWVRPVGRLRRRQAARSSSGVRFVRPCLETFEDKLPVNCFASPLAAPALAALEAALSQTEELPAVVASSPAETTEWLPAATSDAAPLPLTELDGETTFVADAAASAERSLNADKADTLHDNTADAAPVALPHGTGAPLHNPAPAGDATAGATGGGYAPPAVPQAQQTDAGPAPLAASLDNAISANHSLLQSSLPQANSVPLVAALPRMRHTIPSRPTPAAPLPPPRLPSKTSPTQPSTPLTNDVLPGGGTLAVVPVAVSSAAGLDVGYQPVANLYDADANPSFNAYQATLDWGDGSTPTNGIILGSNGSFQVLGDHTYAQAGSYPVSISVQDVDGDLVTTAAQAVVAANPGSHAVPPGGAALPPGSAGQTNPAGSSRGIFPSGHDGGPPRMDPSDIGIVSFRAPAGGPEQDRTSFDVVFTDPDAQGLGATMLWGDGSSSGPPIGAVDGGAYHTTASHTYADEGSYNWTLTISDGSDGDTYTNTGSVVVSDAALSVVSNTFTAQATKAFSGTALTFQDANTAAPLTDYVTHTIQWGDGSPAVTGTLTSLGNGQVAVTGRHIYPAKGTYTCTVSIVDDGGASLTSAAAIVVTDSPPPPTDPPVVSGSTCPCQQVAQSSAPQADPQAGGGDPLANGYTIAPIRYADGAVLLPATDLSSAGYGTPWGQSRAWANLSGYANWSWNGFGMVDQQLPCITQNGNTYALVSSGTDGRIFTKSGSTYTESFFTGDTLTADTTNHLLVFSDPTGQQIRFYDFSSNWPVRQQGQFYSLTDPYGNVTRVTSTSTDGRITEVQRTTTSGGTTTVESYLYTYFSSGATPNFLQSVTLRRQVNGGAWQNIRTITYSYYDGTLPYGNWGDLQFATLSDGSGNVLDTQYYRYYIAAYGDPVDRLKYSFSVTSYARLAAAVGNPATASDSQVSPNADEFFTYDGQMRVTQEVAQGLGCSSCAGGLGTFTYSYSTSSNSAGFNNWSTKTVETLPDGNQNIVYTNAYAEPILSVYHDTTSGLSWDTFTPYDTAGRIQFVANPSAVTGYSESYANLVGPTYQDLSTNSGLITQYDWYASTTANATTAGGVIGYLQDVKIRQGQTGTNITQEAWQYFLQTANGASVAPVASDTVYRNTNGTGAETTSYSYTWVTGTVGMQSETVSAPVISSAQNGPGTADVSTVYFDSYGNAVWYKDPDGYIFYTAFDIPTGAVVKTIDDVNTNNTGDFTNLPSGWVTPTGGGLHLITIYQVDALGRDTKQVDPAGNITYWVFNDPNHWVREYDGWNSSTGMPTGPTLMYREDRPGSYVEELSMTATPHLTNGAPDGTEAVSGVQTLSRLYTNAAGQYVEGDAYFNLTGVTYSTAAYLGSVNVNYYATLYSYDARGRPNRVQTPNGTIYRTVYDGLNRPVSDWVGTNDTPGSGYWSPTNNTPPANMVQLTAYQYDGGGVGDSNLTQYTEYPGGSAAARVTQVWSDWRDRPVAAKAGVQGTEDTTTHRPIVYATYDNLDQVTQLQQYDGDGVTLSTSNGVPQPPSASLLRAQANLGYDDQGRLFQTQVYDVNPSTGSVSTNALTTNDYYDHRGNLVAQSDPGGLWSKGSYDGVGRLVYSYSTDGAGGTTWAAASSVSGDNVLEQQQIVYDAASNPIEEIDKQRFHDETATGSLGDPNTGPHARVYYAAAYYDAAYRVTGTVDVGTNGGSAWTRPSTLPAASDTVLVTSVAYNGAGWAQDITDPRGIDTRLSYDNLGQVLKTVQDYTDGTVTAETNATTEYSYDGNGNLLTVQADEPGGAYQQTKYVYAATTAAGDGVNSNDLLTAVQHPDPTTGQASSSQQDSYLVNALGQLTQYTDRNGNVHQLGYDVLGRLTSDAVTTLGAGVDGSVRRREIAYNTQGNPYLFTSFDAASGGNIVNQVQRSFNGLGQLTNEYQSHSGAVNTSSTPQVQYAYTEMAGGVNNSRPVSMTYPNGRVLNFNFAAGLDSNISRLTSISDTSATLESYKYLGLDTVVERDHPQNNVNLTYIQQGSDPNANHDGGDKYTGLDRFGRVIDQNLYNTSTQTSVDRYQYGYDRDSNVLWQQNLVSASNSDLYTYDNLNQLTSFQRGTLNSTHTGLMGSPTHSQSWGLDALGNFTSVTTDSTTQTRTANQQNEITSISNAGAVTYDANGNLTADGSGNTFVYDAWNELIAVKNGSNTLAGYSYDGMGRRITETHGSTATDLYYDASWQVVEERQGGQVQAQNVWSPGDIDILVERDQSSQHNGVLDQRLYVLQDADGNVTALVDTSGNVVERYLYDPYGAVTILAPDWSVRGISSYAATYLYQDKRFDGAVGLYDSRWRVYSPSLARPLQADPLGLAPDINGYRWESNSPTNGADPSGLEPMERQLKPGLVRIWKDGPGVGGTGGAGAPGGVPGGGGGGAPLPGKRWLNIPGLAGWAASPEEIQEVLDALLAPVYGAGDMLKYIKQRPWAIITAKYEFLYALFTDTEGTLSQLWEEASTDPARFAGKMAMAWLIWGPSRGKNRPPKGAAEPVPAECPEPPGGLANRIAGPRRTASGASGGKIITPSQKLQRWAQQRGYVDPITNEWVAWDGSLSAGHIFPADLIRKLPGFRDLTTAQQEWLLNHPDNFMPLPRQWNSSMGNRLADDWATTPRGKLASKAYIDNLREAQQAFEAFARTMIEFFLGE